MIPQERVNEGYVQYQKSTYYENPSEESAFKSGVRFAEAELQPKSTTSAEAKQNLFNYFAQEHGIQLMDSDFIEIQEYMKPEVQQKSEEFGKYVSSILDTVWVWDEEDNVWRSVKDGKMSIKHVLPEAAVTSKEIYGLETNKFHKVNLVCLSPNHWGNNNVGNKHYMFMLEGCKTAEHIRGFHNENLISDLLTHRKVIEVLGNTSTIPPTDDQLSGLGFNATVRDELVVKLQGTHKRMVKIIF